MLYYLEVYDIRFIYFVNPITHKSINIFVILFYYFIFILNLLYQNHNK